jgi:hypothetical protein
MATLNVAQNPGDLLGTVAVAAPTVSIGSCILPLFSKSRGGLLPAIISFSISRFIVGACHWNRLAQATTNAEYNMESGK